MWFLRWNPPALNSACKKGITCPSRSSTEEMKEKKEFRETRFRRELFCFTKEMTWNLLPGGLETWHSCCSFVPHGSQAQGKATMWRRTEPSQLCSNGAGPLIKLYLKVEFSIT